MYVSKQLPGIKINIQLPERNKVMIQFKCEGRQLPTPIHTKNFRN